MSPMAVEEEEEGGVIVEGETVLLREEPIDGVLEGATEAGPGVALNGVTSFPEQSIENS